jgi:hypothetical protein
MDCNTAVACDASLVIDHRAPPKIAGKAMTGRQTLQEFPRRIDGHPENPYK